MIRIWYNTIRKEFAMKENKRFYLFGILGFCAVNLFSFLIFFIPNYVIEADIGWFEYVRIFINKFAEFALPPIAAALLIKVYFNGGIKNALIGAIYFSLPRIIYLLPYYYLYHIAYGYDSIESISLSALVTVFGVALMWAHITLLFLIIRMFAIRSIAKSLATDLPPAVQKSMTVDLKKKLNQQAEKSLCTEINFTGAFDFSIPLTLGIFAATFGEFIINFMRESVDTVTYLINYAGYYRMGEIIYITACFVFLIVELLAVHLIAYHLFKKANSIKETNDIS